MPVPVTYQDNTSTLLPKEDYGVKISKAGFDALTAQDNDLLFDSAWPSVQITMVKAVPETTAFYTVIPHGLGFPPVAFVIGGTAFRTSMFGCNVDDTNVYVGSGLAGFVGGGTLVVYHVDISTDIEYPYTATQSVNTIYNTDYGIKMVKPTLDIDSTDLRDYVLHSRCGSPLVLAVKTQATVNPANPLIVQYTSHLGYPTLNFGYAGIPRGTVSFNITYGAKAYQFAPQGGQAAPIAFTDGFTVYTAINSFSDGRASVVCLRSPMFATTNTVAVNY